MKNFSKTLLIAVGAGVGFFLVFWLLLSGIFAGHTHLAQSLHLGIFTLQYYGLILAIATAAGYALAMHRRKLYGINSVQADSIIFILIIAGFIGARAYHVISSFNYYSQNPAQILAVWNGGLAIYGVMIGGVIALYFYHKYKMTNLSLWTLLDWLAPSVVLGQIIGRFGNFVNYELYGSPTSLPWKMFVPIQFRLAPYQMESFFHPLFLYEATGSVIILILLLRLKLRPGGVFLAWLFLYNVMRFFLEQIRIGSTMYGHLRINGFVSLLIAGLALAAYIKYVKPDSQNI